MEENKIETPVKEFTESIGEDISYNRKELIRKGKENFLGIIQNKKI